ncbi:MAG TPA: hypothetical protein VND65_04420, partial [Candidatus Binatia bacterium]|nr:hypothetical protein [Candidatus Binatia bacterium]
MTELEAVKVRLQALVPVQPPDHPPKEFGVVGVSLKLTVAPEVNVALHVPGQLMPAGLLVTVPEPVPARFTVSCGPPVVVVAGLALRPWHPVTKLTAAIS